MADLTKKPLENLIKFLKSAKGQVNVGVMDGSRWDSTKTNAEIGTYMEFGTSKIPARSFLRVPLMEQLTTLRLAKMIDIDLLKECMKEKSLVPWLDRMGVEAVAIVLGGFDSNGYGKWAKWKAPYKNQTGMILVDTQQLRNSIGYEVVD